VADKVGITPSPHEATSEPLALKIQNLSKTFSGTKALNSVDLEVRRGEVHALLGQNGSGKSTLIKILAGYHQADPGADIWTDGQQLDAAGAASREYNLRFVHQELGLVSELSAMDNLALHGGYISSRAGRIKWRKQKKLTEDLLAPFGVTLDVTRPMREAAPLERTVLAIAAALQRWDRLSGGTLVLDEPTAVLPPHEVKQLFDIIRDMKSSGLSVLYVSHRLDEIFEIADTVTVLRDGVKVATRPVAGLTKQSLVTLMLGVDVQDDFGARPPDRPIGEVVLRVRDVTGTFLRGAGMTLRAGEIVGLAGLPGSGREELPYAVARAQGNKFSGSIALGGPESQFVPISAAPSSDVVLVPADRATEGLISAMTVRENLSLSTLGKLTRWGRLDTVRERQLATVWLQRLQVAAPGVDYPIGTLSGGNQQKILIGRCLAQEPHVLVLCEPTAGVDIAARHTIHEFILGLAEQGLAVLVSSSDVEDLVELCSRVLIMGAGAVVRELEGAEISERSVVHAMEGLYEAAA
jgi:ABC-type sugar transport system ATPase subunit